MKPTEDKLSGYFFAGTDGTKREVILTKRRGRPVIRSNPKWYPLEKKVHACTLYAVYGDLEEVHKLTDVPVKELRSWMNETWWQDIIKQVYLEQNDKLSSQISSLLNNSLEVLKDRLENGDYYFVGKTGTLARKPVDARVLAGLFQSLAIQRRLVRGEPTSITANKQTLDDKLDKLAKEFKRFASAKTIEGTVQEDHAIESELQEGLQARTEDSNFEGGGQGSCPEEQSTETCYEEAGEECFEE